MEYFLPMKKFWLITYDWERMRNPNIASSSKFWSIRSAILFIKDALSLFERFDQIGKAFLAASTALFTSSAVADGTEPRTSRFEGSIDWILSVFGINSPFMKLLAWIGNIFLCGGRKIDSKYNSKMMSNSRWMTKVTPIGSTGKNQKI